FHVTGVQTCALPISILMKRPPVYLLQKIPGLWLFVVMISALPVYAHVGPAVGSDANTRPILSTFAGGDGTEANPYQIEDVDQLRSEERRVGKECNCR